MYLAFLLLMVLQSSVFAADWSLESGRYTPALRALAERLRQEREAEEATAQAQAAAQYQQQLNQENIATAAAAAASAVAQYQQQQLNQGSSQGQAKIFSSVVYSDAVTAQNAYNDFVAGRQIFNGEMFTLNQIQDASYYSLYNSLQVRQLTTVLQGADGRYYIVVRLQ